VSLRNVIETRTNAMYVKIDNIFNMASITTPASTQSNFFTKVSFGNPHLCPPPGLDIDQCIDIHLTHAHTHGLIKYVKSYLTSYLTYSL